MAVFGNSPASSEPEAISQPPAEQPEPTPAPTSDFSVSDDALRSALDTMGFDYDTMPEDDREFVREAESRRLRDAAARSELDSPAPAQPAHPLIPTDDQPLTEPEPSQGAPTADDGSGSHGQHPEMGGGSEPSLGAEGEPAGSPGSPPPADSFLLHTQQGDVPIPRDAVERAIQFASSVSDEEVALLNAIRNGLMMPVQIDPQTRQPMVPAGAVPPTPPEPWVDEQAQQAFQTVESQLAQMTQEQAAMREMLMDRQRERMVENIDVGVARFAQSHGFTITDGQPDAGLDTLINRLGQMNILPVYAQQFPGDPGAAVEAALDALYWSTPEYREAALQTQISQHAEQTRTVEEKKANNGAIATTPGSAPRETPTYQRGMSREDQVNRMAEFIANARPAGVG